MPRILCGKKMKLNPYLHFDQSSIYNPCNDGRINSTDRQYEILRELINGECDVGKIEDCEVGDLVERQFLIPGNYDPSEQYFLKFVSLETHSVCNQGCYFCPVSLGKKDKIFMTDALFDSILDQLANHADSLEGVFLNGYNEPTLDKRLYDQLCRFSEREIPVALNSNATGLTPDLVGKIAELDVVSFLSVNLSTLDRERYLRERRGDHLDVVLRNVDYLSKSDYFERMQIVVLGAGDDDHARDFEMISNRYWGTSFKIVSYPVNDRTGSIPLVGKSSVYHESIKGCEQTGSRVIQHLHINPEGKCIICCQDYHENYVVGDLNSQTIHQVMSGAEMQKLRKLTYGIENAPKDFICRHCEFAIRR